jgi:hypothetical protein
MNTIHQGQLFNLEVLTPVHVGMGKEKDYIKGLDFIYKNHEYQILDQQKLLSGLPPNEIAAVSANLASGNMDEFSRYIQAKNLITKNMIQYTWSSEYVASDREPIKRTMQDGMGRWFIPGSSLKGAIRSAIATILHKKDKLHDNINIESLLGKIENNVMRFVQVTDCITDGTPGIFPIKIFSADKNGGAWKHERRGGHSEKFKPVGFVSFYEMLTDEISGHATKGDFRINWGMNEFMRQRKTGQVPNLDSIFNNNGIDWLIEALRAQTSIFIKKEVEFFKKFENEFLDYGNFLDELVWLEEENRQTKDGCILRVGGNVGWHSITGDWRFDDFSEAVEKNRGHLVGKMEKAYKTRKLIFDGDRFALPGFIKITKNEVRVE